MPAYPVKMVVVEGAVARAFQRAPAEFTSVKSAEDADKALNDPQNAHHCPLCNQFFGTIAFKTHAPECIKVRAPAWERQRDDEPYGGKMARIGKRMIVPGHDPAEEKRN